MGGAMSIRTGKHGRADNGASLVEFALLAPLVFALLLGMFTGGISLSRQNSMANAVREASRLGATLEEDADWATAVRSRVEKLAGGDLETGQICVKLVKKESDGTETDRQSTSCSAELTPEEPSAADVPNGQCIVKVWAGRDSDFNVVFFSRTLQLRTDAINLYERAGESGSCA